MNLSNRLNPNNVHFDRQLAAQYKHMSKHEKEALWAADRARQHQLRELTELSQMAGLSATELSQLTELTQVNESFVCYRLPCHLPDAVRCMQRPLWTIYLTQVLQLYSRKSWYFGYCLHDHCLDFLQVSSRPRCQRG